MPTLAVAHPRAIASLLPATGAGVGYAGRLFFASDTGALYYDTGTAWVNISATLPATPALIAAIQAQSYVYGRDSGTANAYTASPTTPAPAIVEGSLICFKAAHANTGASTLTVGSTTAAIVKQGTVALTGGEIAANQIVRVIFDGTNFQI